jgi:hypothetical protein
MKRDLSSLGHGVVVQRSTLRGAGLGLFAARDFASNAVITEYDGIIVGWKDALHSRNSGKHSHIRSLSSQHSAIDGARFPVRNIGGGSFINHQPKSSSNATFIVNDKYNRGLIRSSKGLYGGACVEFNQSSNQFSSSDELQECLHDSTHILIKATRPIAKGDEIFVNYGRGYWKHDQSLTMHHVQPDFIITVRFHNPVEWVVDNFDNIVYFHVSPSGVANLNYRKNALVACMHHLYVCEDYQIMNQLVDDLIAQNQVEEWSGMCIIHLQTPDVSTFALRQGFRRMHDESTFSLSAPVT